VILAGFSFGGPSVWAAARRLGPDRVCGVAAIAGSARGGDRFRDAQLDTEGGVRAMDGEGPRGTKGAGTLGQPFVGG
jgi:pimeloyl-ACP methyl ester carboxylesterase